MLLLQGLKGFKLKPNNKLSSNNKLYKFTQNEK